MRYVMLATAILVTGFTPLRAQQRFTVNSVADASDATPGDGTCSDAGGGCTLRAAIQEANASAGVDTIAFGIIGQGPHTIQPATGYPVITDPVVIDGYTQPGASVNTNPPTMGTNAVLMIAITSTGDPFVVSAGNSTIRGLAVAGGADDLVSLTTNGGNTIEGNLITPSPGVSGVRLDSPNNLVGGTTPAARNVIGGGAAGITVFSGAGNVIEGNLIGTDATGAAPLTNTFAGIEVRAPSATIGGAASGAGNVISANGTGIAITGTGADEALIRDNLIGTDVTGTVALGNTMDGIEIDEGLHHLIGGNVISGNGRYGIVLFDNADSAVVVDNYIGVDGSGMAALPNGNAGIRYSTSGHVIGEAGLGNVIAGNGGAGILITGHESVIRGNLIGTGASGTLALGNGVGVLIDDGSSNTIGGLAAGAGNVIAANDQFGVSITGLSPGNVIQGNFIGTDAGAGLNLGNGVGSGKVGVLIDAQNTTIEQNTIAFSGDAGVLIAGGTGNRVLQNAIFSNMGLGIDLGATGVTPNDAGDGDAGANTLQNFPLVTLAYLAGGTAVEGTFNGAASSTFTLEFFASGACDGTDHGEGETYLGSIMVTTGGGGDAGFTATLPTTAAAGDVVTATATDAAGNTSEFSPCVRVGAQPAFVVTATDDVTDGVCSDGHCSLREAIDAANARSGSDTIAFDIPGLGPHTIQPSTLPEITDSVVIDGYTQPGASPNTNAPDQGTNAALMIVLNAISTNGVGLDISAGNSTVRGLVIHNAGDWAVRLFTNGGNTIAGNFLGTDPLGNNPVGQSSTVVQLLSSDNTVGGTAPADRNVIGGGGVGVQVLTGATGNVIQGNLIGIGATGTSVLNVQFRGIHVLGDGTTIGGTAPGAGNVVSGATEGITLGNGAGSVVQGNLIGTDVTGTQSRGNQSLGISVQGTATGTVIGGTVPAARNVVSGNGNYGILIEETDVMNTLVQGNYIGTDATGLVALPNDGAGVRLAGNSSLTTVGGTTSGAGNVISGNGGNGIDIDFGAHDNLVQGNLIGTDATGTASLPNAFSGVQIEDASDNTVGGTASGAGNTIAFNGAAGVTVVAGTGNAIRGNAIHSNDEIGIDLAADGLTPNDAGDGDAGANNLQNFPLLTLAYLGSTTVEGGFHGVPSTTLTLEFFASAACDASDHGEGETLLGATMVTTDGAGDATFTATLAGTTAAGDVITATATDAAGNTSEFSPCVTVLTSPAFVVNVTDDTNDGVCSTGNCSLRDAITAANARVGTDTIRFAIPGTGPHTIALGGSLPAITDPVVIDGFTQAGATPNTNPPTAGTNAVYSIVLDATNTGGEGLLIIAGGSTVRGLRIEAAPDHSIGILTNGGNRIEGNILLPGSNAFGVYVETPDNTIGGTAPAARNVISGGATGIWIEDAGTGNVVRGNLIGTDAAGTGALGNQFAGVSTGASSTIIGGTDPGAGNVISANGAGVVIRSDATGVLIQGNLIGTDVTGTQALGNQGTGVEINSTATDNTIGGTTAAARNVISGNGQDGVRIQETGATDNVVRGNYIGTDVAGGTAMPNVEYGVHLAGNSSGTAVGGTAPGAGNVISGNGLGGIFLSGSSDNVVQGNLIGTDAAGTAALGNTGTGVTIDAVAGNAIGGTATGAGNTIAFNTGDGVQIASGTGHGILGNAIHDNGALGIDLAGDGLTANDAGDGDAGPNDLQNFPTIDVALTGSAVLEGTFNGAADATLRLEFFSSDACDPSGNGEGERLLGSTMVTTDGSGEASFAVSLAGPASPGDAVTATATDDQNNTSEFSACVIGVGYATTASPSEATVVRGESVDYTVTVSAEAGTFDRDVTLSCQGLPAGATCDFAPTTVQPGASSATSTLIVSTSDPMTPTGSSGFTIVGSYGTIARTFDATLTVTDFTVAVDPASTTVARGADATYTVSVAPDGGSFGQPVDLTCINLPANTTCTFSPAQVTPGASPATSTLTVSTAAPDTPTGAATFTVTGTSGALARSTTTDLVVTDFVLAVAPGDVTARRGEAGTFTLTVNPDGGGFEDPITFGCAGLPAQAACTFSPATATPGTSAATVTVSVQTADPGTPTGAKTFTITGTSGSLTQTASAAVTVIDFTLAVAPAAVTVSRGGSASLTVTVAPDGAAFGETVALACADLASGVTCGFAPAVVTPGTGPATSTLTLSAASVLAARGSLPAGAPLRAGIPWTFPLLLLSLAGTGAALSRRRRRRRIANWIVGMALGAALAGLACGDDVMGPDQPVTTTFTITGTSGTLVRSMTATVTVD